MKMFQNDIRRWITEASRLTEMNEMPDIEREFPILYHGTSSKHIRSILAVGLDAPTHWGSLDIAKFFAKQECHEIGGRPVLIQKPISEFYSDGFRLDENMIDFPVLTDIRGADHGALAEAWEESEQDWQACLRIYESVIYNAPVAVARDEVIR